MEMYAYFVITRRRGVRFWWEAVLGMPLLRVELPKKKTARTQRNLHRALYLLGVHRVFNHPDGWESDSLPPLNATRPLWTAKAAQASLLLLARKGILPEDAVIELRGARFVPECHRLIETLLPKVRGFHFSMPVSEGTLWYLQRQYGLSPVPHAGDIAIGFSPGDAGADLPLGTIRPNIAGLELRAKGIVGSEDCPVEPLLTALLEQGRLQEKDIEVHDILLDIQFNNNYNAVDNVPL